MSELENLISNLTHKSYGSKEPETNSQIDQIREIARGDLFRQGHRSLWGNDGDLSAD